MVWLGRRHHAFAVANGVLNRRFSAATVKCCGDGWKLGWVAGGACNMTENALSIQIVIFSVHLQQTEISERKLLIFHLGKQGTLSKMNPFRIAREINEICSKVENIDHRRSGSILITTKTAEQAKILLCMKIFTSKQILVTAVPESQTGETKLFKGRSLCHNLQKIP